MALHTGLRHKEPLAGILALSCYLPLATHIAKEGHANNRRIPIFMAHGNADLVVLWQWANLSRASLESLGYPVEFKTYAMAHEVCYEEIFAIGQWLKNHL